MPGPIILYLEDELCLTAQKSCAVKHKVAIVTRYALFPDGTHFALSGIGGSVKSFVRGVQPRMGVKKPACTPAFSL